MAEIKSTHTEIELTNTGYTYSAEKNDAMPRMDRCHNCGKVQALHTDNKCLFDASSFTPVDLSYADFRVKFLAWGSGQKIEEALCNIVYELTRRDR